MVNPDNMNIGVPIKKLDGISGKSKDRPALPSKPVKKEFKEVLEDKEQLEAGVPVSQGIGKAVSDIAKSKSDTKGVDKQSVMDLLASKSNKKVGDKKGDSSQAAPLVTSDHGLSGDLLTEENPSPDQSIIAEADSTPETDVGQSTTLVGWPAGAPLKGPTTKVEKPDDKQSPFKVYETAYKPRSPLSDSEDDTDYTSTSPVPAKKILRPDTQFTEVTPDLSFVNPLHGVISGATATTPIVGEVSPSVPQVDRAALISHIQALADKVVDSVYTLDQSGKTETIVTLKNMPLFNDARIILTSFNTAPKEYNVAFENLRPDAKQVIDQNLNTLRVALDDQGFVNVIHILSTTTIIEHPLPGDNTGAGQSFARGDREGNAGEGGPGGRKRGKG